MFPKNMLFLICKFHYQPYYENHTKFTHCRYGLQCDRLHT